jgi:hypothetical protein
MCRFQFQQCKVIHFGRQATSISLKDVSPGLCTAFYLDLDQDAGHVAVLAGNAAACPEEGEYGIAGAVVSVAVAAAAVAVAAVAVAVVAVAAVAVAAVGVAAVAVAAVAVAAVAVAVAVVAVAAVAVVGSTSKGQVFLKANNIGLPVLLILPSHLSKINETIKNILKK